MGIYFIAAGSSTENRNKSLDRGFKRKELEGYLSPIEYTKLCEHYGENDDIFIWGAKEGRPYSQLRNVKQGEYVVDVKNTEVVQVFTYCFYIDTGQGARLQNAIGWDSELPVETRRRFRYVFFLKNPVPTKHSEKAFYQEAFGETSPHWLDGQKYFDDKRIEEAMMRKGFSTPKDFLGIEPLQENEQVETRGSSQVETEVYEIPEKQDFIEKRPFKIVPAWVWIVLVLLVLYFILK